MFRLKLGMNLTRSGANDGLYGSVGGGRWDNIEAVREVELIVWTEDQRRE